MASEETIRAGDITGGRLINQGTAEALVAVNVKLKAFVDFVGRWASLLFVPMILVTVYDVCLRKTGKLQIDLKYAAEEIGLGPLFESTLLQETEWHLHTALFALVLGFGCVWNTQVRVDVVREHLAFRRKAWMELLGATFFMIPYTLVVAYFAAEFAYDSWAISEISASQVGLPHRWIIKTILTCGLLVAAVAGFSVWLQCVLALAAPRDMRYALMTLEWPESDGDSFEGKERMAVDLSVSVEEDLQSQTKKIVGEGGGNAESSAIR
jgi:TRAP-type mannitol/chloroaromatic compound transport system permease small subunit